MQRPVCLPVFTTGDLARWQVFLCRQPTACSNDAFPRSRQVTSCITPAPSWSCLLPQLNRDATLPRPRRWRGVGRAAPRGMAAVAASVSSTSSYTARTLGDRRRRGITTSVPGVASTVANCTLSWGTYAPVIHVSASHTHYASTRVTNLLFSVFIYSSERLFIFCCRF